MVTVTPPQTAPSLYVQVVRYLFSPLEGAPRPERISANAWRGVFGLALRHVTCQPECRDPDTCSWHPPCSYRTMFAPQTLDGPSGLRQPPRPFVLRPHGLSLGVHLFIPGNRYRTAIGKTIAEIARLGVGPERQPLRINGVTWEPPRWCPLSANATVTEGDQQRLQVSFLTPTELKADGESVCEPLFSTLFARIRDRVATLASLYGGASSSLPIDFAGLGKRAHAIRLVSHNLRWESRQRRSAHTGQSHALGGFLGTAVYEGNLNEFRPWLEAARWTGAGRHTVWGHGALSLTWDG